MVAHFWLEEFGGMAWSGLMVAAGILGVGVRTLCGIRRAKVPGAVKVWLKVKLEAPPVEKLPSSARTSWKPASSLVQVTVSPTAMVTVCGWNAKSAPTTTWWVAAPAGSAPAAT